MNKCRVCGKIYKYKGSLIKHEDLVHQVDERTSILVILWKRLRGEE